MTVHSNPDLISSFLSDAAHVPGGYALGVTFPRSVAEVVTALRETTHVLPIGAQSSLTGGATPRGDVVLSTRALTGIEVLPDRRVRVGAGAPLAELQRVLSAQSLYYPPVPTFDGAFVGGTIATNAAGAATFKYGSTRRWVEGLTVVLADGSVLSIERGETAAATLVPVPTYVMPEVPKLSAGYYAKPGMDLVDLFIGSEGTLGVIVEATLRVIAMPTRITALITCSSDAQAVAVTAALREDAMRARRDEGPLDVAAIEYMDARSLSVVSDDAFRRAGIARPRPGAVLVLVQIEVTRGADAAIQAFGDRLTNIGVENDPIVALPEDHQGAVRMFELREAVPSSVNSRVATTKARVHPDIQKTAGDMIVPFNRLEESIAFYQRLFAERDLDYAIWGHLSDGNLHPNVIPRTVRDVEEGRAAILEMGRRVVAMGGAPLAEHGVGRSPLKQQLLRDLYGDRGIEEMRAVKRALDPEWKLSSGVLFPPP